MHGRVDVTMSPAPRHKPWASKAVLGERVWLNRHSVPIPEHHRRAANILTMISASGLVPPIFGVALTALGKLWFVDRMAWLYEEMKDARPDYRAWLY